MRIGDSPPMDKGGQIQMSKKRDTATSVDVNGYSYGDQVAICLLYTSDAADD